MLHMEVRSLIDGVLSYCHWAIFNLILTLDCVPTTFVNEIKNADGNALTKVYRTKYINDTSFFIDYQLKILVGALGRLCREDGPRKSMLEVLKVVTMTKCRLLTQLSSNFQSMAMDTR